MSSSFRYMARLTARQSCSWPPHNLSGQIPWQQRQAGVYDCRWGTDTIRVIVAGELPREPYNAPLHLFSASPDLVGFASSVYRRRSEQTSRLLRQLFKRFQGEGLVMVYTMEDFNRQYAKEHFAQLTPDEQREALQALPPEKQAVPRSVNRREARQAAQAAPQEVMGHRSW